MRSHPSTTFDNISGSQAAGAAFKDTWGLDDINLAWHGLIKHDHPGLYDLLNTTRIIHGDSMMSYLIYMAVRIMEMKRLLKPTSSIYLHCDSTASHYIKLLLDAIFGRKNFRNEIVWQRASKSAKGSQHRAKTLGRDTDNILHYSKTNLFTHYETTHPLTEKELEDRFPYVDNKGRRYNTSTPIFRAPSMGERPNLCYTYKGVTNPHPSGWRVSKAKLIEMDEKEEIIWREGKNPRRKSYADNYKGKPIGSLWVDIPIASKTERIGYPTQKPLALLDRIIRASSSRGDVVLDPFCGCATTCIAAERLGRQWVGIDIAPKAAELVMHRMEKELGLFFKGVHRTDIPNRTDLGKIIRYNDIHNKRDLYGEQGGYCNGCEEHFELRHLTVDHIIAKSKGGTDHISNLQLLCGHCNSVKGNRPQEYLLACLTDKGWIKRKKSA